MNGFEPYLEEHRDEFFSLSNLYEYHQSVLTCLDEDSNLFVGTKDVDKMVDRAHKAFVCAVTIAEYARRYVSPMKDNTGGCSIRIPERRNTVETWGILTFELLLLRECMKALEPLLESECYIDWPRCATSTYAWLTETSALDAALAFANTVNHNSLILMAKNNIAPDQYESIVISHQALDARVCEWISGTLGELFGRIPSKNEWPDWKFEQESLRIGLLVVEEYSELGHNKNGATIKTTSIPQDINDETYGVDGGRGAEIDHSEDFRSVRVKGVQYDFTAIQAVCVSLLYESYCKGTPDVGGDTLLQRAGSESKRLTDIFKGSPAWGKLIVPGGTRGAFRLKIS